MKQILWLAIWECFSSKNNVENFVISQIIQKIKNKPWLNFIWGGGKAPPKPPISTPVPAIPCKSYVAHDLHDINLRSMSEVVIISFHATCRHPSKEITSLLQIGPVYCFMYKSWYYAKTVHVLPCKFTTPCGIQSWRDLSQEHAKVR